MEVKNNVSFSHGINHSKSLVFFCHKLYNEKIIKSDKTMEVTTVTNTSILNVSDVII